MTHHAPHHPEHSNILTQIFEGMEVYDQPGEKVGTVRDVYLGAVTEEEDERGLGPATVSPAVGTTSSLMDDFIQAMSSPQGLPDALRQRFLRQGFIRINTSGLFRADCYALPEQIAGVSEGRVLLQVPGKELVSR